MAGKDASRERILRGSIAWEMLRFGAPIALGMGLQTTFNLVDAYLVSRLPGEVAGPALGAIGICDQLVAIGTIVSFGLTTASTAMIAHARGRGDQEAVRRMAWQSLLLVGALSVIFGVGMAVLAGPIMRDLVGAKGDVATLGTTYLQVISGGAFSIYFLLQLTSIQRALGSAKLPVALLLLSNVLNLFLAVLFVYGPGAAPPIFSWGPPIAAALRIPRMELVGAAWATVLARVIVLVPVVVSLARSFDVFPRRAAMGPDRVILRSMVGLAWPSSTQLVVRIVAMLITNSLVARAFTTPEDQRATTALGIAFRLETMALFVALGWGSASQTFVGQNLGAGQAERARASGQVAALYDAALMILLGLGYHVWAAPVVRFFDADPAVVALGVSYVGVVAWSYVGLGTGVVLGSAMAGGGATRTALLADLAVIVAFQIPASVLCVMMPGATPERLWAAVAATYALSAVVYLLVYRFAAWTERAAVLSATAPR
jgi:putative MATE family efflux protein